MSRIKTLGMSEEKEKEKERKRKRKKEIQDNVDAYLSGAVGGSLVSGSSAKLHPSG